VSIEPGIMAIARTNAPELTKGALDRLPEEPDRPGLEEGPGGFLLPGIRLQTSRSDYRPLEHVYLYRYDNKEWVKASGLLHARG
jgi:hypothetical protein